MASSRKDVASFPVSLYTYDVMRQELVFPPGSRLYIPFPNPCTSRFHTFCSQVFLNYIDTRLDIIAEWYCLPGYDLKMVQYDLVDGSIHSSSERLTEISRQYTRIADMFLHNIDFKRYHEFRFVKISSEEIRVVCIPEWWRKSQPLEKFPKIGECHVKHVGQFITNALHEYPALQEIPLIEKLQ
ncbi:hypothetical protein JTE90_027178 [Oedothorax gibbosus]|uniref:Uncharacterized protein n=1 Tax=Oedothorax gibbosus TaxID=931172 RepID=A0AAV6TIL6_9ARAC|nr:hypothetical protein JTE90_027178 [Oedothorax gibbosus]